MAELRHLIKKWIYGLDALLAWIRVGLGFEKGLIVLTLHGLAEEPRLNEHRLDVRQVLSLNKLETVIIHFLESGYSFVTPRSLGTQTSGKMVMLTFDDGYANNLLAVPLLKKYGIPAIVFVSTGHCKQKVGFWWDALWRKGRGASPRQAKAFENLGKRIKTLPGGEAAELIECELGVERRHLGEADRPLTPEEIAAMDSNGLMEWGNHSESHAIFTCLDPTQIIVEVDACQKDLKDWTGRTPLAIAYPNGNLSQAALDACVDSGLQYGFTTLPGRNALPVMGGTFRAMTLKRNMLHEDLPIILQCLVARGGLIVNWVGALRSRSLR